MSNQTLENAQPGQAGEKPQEPTQQGSAGAGAPPQFVTTADLEAWANRILKSQEDTLGRLKQSMGAREDNIRAEIDQRVADYLKTAQSAGLTQATMDKRVEEIKSQVVDGRIASGGAPTQGKPTETQQPPDLNAVAEMLENIQRLQVEAGVFLHPWDEENKAIVELGPNPPMDAYERTFRDQLAKKAAKLGKTIPPSPTASPMARSGSTGAGAPAAGHNPIENVTDPHELLKMGLK